MITLQTLNEVKASALPECVKDYLIPTIEHLGLGDPNASFEDSLGGAFYILENAQEASSIRTAEGHPILKRPGTFDAVEEKGGWYVFLLCTSNAGGPTHLVPPNLVTKNMVKSKTLTDAIWF